MFNEAQKSHPDSAQKGAGKSSRSSKVSGRQFWRPELSFHCLGQTPRTSAGRLAHVVKLEKRARWVSDTCHSEHGADMSVENQTVAPRCRAADKSVSAKPVVLESCCLPARLA